MEKQKKKILGQSTIALIVTLIIAIVVLVLLKIVNTARISIEYTLLGEESITLEVGSEYKEEGYIAQYNQKEINDKVKVSSNVNTDVLGNYEIKYNLRIDYLAINETLIRKVCVVDTTKPNLTIDSEKEKTICIGDKYSEPTYAAIDNYDGDITKNVKVQSNLNLEKVGTYEIVYSVLDSSGNEASDKVIVQVKQKKNPYIVVSISNQTLKYYEYGEVVLSSNVVTGINGKTPIGKFKVLNKARNIILKGKDYESFVSYWIAFKGVAFGFHDASWRSKFGGTIYKYNGSHGCVNMPYSKVQKLYNMVSIGTPVYIKK